MLHGTGKTDLNVASAVSQHCRTRPASAAPVGPRLPGLFGFKRRHGARPPAEPRARRSVVSAQTVDEINILQAALAAMSDAVAALGEGADYVIDGNRLPPVRTLCAVPELLRRVSNPHLHRRKDRKVVRATIMVTGWSLTVC